MVWWKSLLNIPGMLIENYREKKQQQHEIEKAVMQNKARLASSEQSHNSNWEMEALRVKDKLLRRFSFFIFTLPILITVFNPEYGNKIFINLDSVPGWFLKIWLIMIGAIWGVAKLKDVAVAIMGRGK